MSSSITPKMLSMMPIKHELISSQFAVISDGRLPEAPTVRQLLRYVEPVKSNDFVMGVLDRFLNDSALYALPVVDGDDKPIALLDRKRHIEFFSKPYARELFDRRKIADLFAHPGYGHSEPIVVEDDCSIEDVAKIIIDAGMQHMVTGFLISSQGKYQGVANGHDLLSIITQRVQAELFYLAHFDNLTGIPNRALLNDRLHQACCDAKRKKKLVALLLVDVDRFKQINDSLGHSAGDIVLRQVAERLKASARDGDTVARLGGDEFVILMDDITNPLDVEVFAQRVVDSMNEPFEFLGHTIVITVSIGSAIYPKDDTEISPLLAKADAAMYEVKTAGRNGFRRYSPGTTMYNPTRLLLGNELRHAIDRKELVLFFQPQINLASQEICGEEALVRWRHPSRGIVSPAEFIPFAEESGLIIPLGEWVLREALRQAKEWQDQGMPPLRISINISATQFYKDNFITFLKDQLAEFQVDPHMVELELTESVLMQNVEKVLKSLHEIKSLGVSLAIDDFGTGFSSLSYLRRFPIDRLKIDQSFVRGIENTPANESISRAIVSLAKSLSLGVVAEGIEQPAEMAVLERMQCNEGQGYLFAKPMPATDLFAWAQAHKSHDLISIRSKASLELAVPELSLTSISRPVIAFA